MSAPGAWWLLPTDWGAPGRRRHVTYLEHLFADLGHTLSRHCPDFPHCAHPCRRCWDAARRFNAWVQSQ